MLRATYVRKPVTPARRADGMPSLNRSETDTLLPPCDDRPADAADRPRHTEVTVADQPSEDVGAPARTPARTLISVVRRPAFGVLLSTLATELLPIWFGRSNRPPQRGIGGCGRCDRTPSARTGEVRFGHIGGARLHRSESTRVC